MCCCAFWPRRDDIHGFTGPLGFTGRFTGPSRFINPFTGPLGFTGRFTGPLRFINLFTGPLRFVNLLFTGPLGFTGPSRFINPFAGPLGFTGPSRFINPFAGPLGFTGPFRFTGPFTGPLLARLGLLTRLLAHLLAYSGLLAGLSCWKSTENRQHPGLLAVSLVGSPPAPRL